MSPLRTAVSPVLICRSSNSRAVRVFSLFDGRRFKISRLNLNAIGTFGPILAAASPVVPLPMSGSTVSPCLGAVNQPLHFAIKALGMGVPFFSAGFRAFRKTIIALDPYRHGCFRVQHRLLCMKTLRKLQAAVAAG